MKEVPFYPADILLPKRNFESWAVIACDQYTSEPEYWDKVKKNAGEAPSALQVILPEVYLSENNDTNIERVNRTMAAYLQDGIFTEYKDAFVYHERTQRDGRVKQGLIGVIDFFTG